MFPREKDDAERDAGKGAWHKQINKQTDQQLSTQGKQLRHGCHGDELCGYLDEKNIQGSNETKKKKVKETPVLFKDRRRAGKRITIERKSLCGMLFQAERPFSVFIDNIADGNRRCNLEKVWC